MREVDEDHDAKKEKNESSKQNSERITLKNSLFLIESSVERTSDNKILLRKCETDKGPKHNLNIRLEKVCETTRTGQEKKVTSWTQCDEILPNFQPESTTTIKKRVRKCPLFNQPEFCIIQPEAPVSLTSIQSSIPQMTITTTNPLPPSQK